jgi:riboflavin synthase
MFTGLVQSMGRITALQPDTAGGLTMTVAAEFAGHTQLGESIAVNGACLTVVRLDAASVDFQLGPETLAKTTFRRALVNDPVNLERSLRVGDPLGGHWVTGHIDAVGRIERCIVSGDWLSIWFLCETIHDSLMVHKGSIAVDGVSLTLVDVEPGRFSVMLIPHTQAHTTLGQKREGAMVNLEFDLLAKHVHKLFQTLTIVI